MAISDLSASPAQSQSNCGRMPPKVDADVSQGVPGSVHLTCLFNLSRL
jgi:hypothetical protein